MEIDKNAHALVFTDGNMEICIPKGEGEVADPLSLYLVALSCLIEENNEVLEQLVLDKLDSLGREVDADIFEMEENRSLN